METIIQISPIVTIPIMDCLNRPSIIISRNFLLSLIKRLDVPPPPFSSFFYPCYHVSLWPNQVRSYLFSKNFLYYPNNIRFLFPNSVFELQVSSICYQVIYIRIYYFQYDTRTWRLSTSGEALYSLAF